MEQKIGFCSTEQVTFVERKFAVSMRSLVSRSAELLGVPKRIKCGAAWGRKPLKEEAPALLPARLTGSGVTFVSSCRCWWGSCVCTWWMRFFLHAPLLDVWLVGHSHAGRVLQLSRWFYMGANTINKAAAATVATSRIFAVSCKNVGPN